LRGASGSSTRALRINKRALTSKETEPKYSKNALISQREN